jgi:hypothetical protein
MHPGVQNYVAMLGVLAYDLAMHLAFRRHIDDQVSLDFRLASKPAAFRKWFEFTALAVARFNLADRRQVFGSRANRMLGELALGATHLATTAKATPTTHRINVNTKTACGIEHGRAMRECPASPGRRKDYF